MDIIFLHGLRVQCVIGVWQWERRINQSVYIDIDMAWDTAKAARSDDLADTLSYKDVSKRIATVAREGEFNLVETLAERVAAVIIDEFAAPWCRVRVNKKGAVSSAADVGVIIERGSKP
ncbi:MAG: dihydroneopterin aldolase [Gammaproteobacteria bacterium]|nr:dihydroneopterin aldolase [Gammaproteobacteria bacterium]